MNLQFQLNSKYQKACGNTAAGSCLFSLIYSISGGTFLRVLNSFEFCACLGSVPLCYRRSDNRFCSYCYCERAETYKEGIYCYGYFFCGALAIDALLRVR